MRAFFLAFPLPCLAELIPPCNYTFVGDVAHRDFNAALIIIREILAPDTNHPLSQVIGQPRPLAHPNRQIPREPVKPTKALLLPAPHRSTTHTSPPDGSVVSGPHARDQYLVNKEAAVAPSLMINNETRAVFFPG